MVREKGGERGKTWWAIRRKGSKCLQAKLLSSPSKSILSDGLPLHPLMAARNMLGAHRVNTQGCSCVNTQGNSCVKSPSINLSKFTVKM